MNEISRRKTNYRRRDPEAREDNEAWQPIRYQQQRAQRCFEEVVYRLIDSSLNEVYRYRYTVFELGIFTIL